MYLPKCNFSLRSKEPAIATSTSNRGLKIDTNSGPLIRTQHMEHTIISPEPIIPYILNHKFDRFLRLRSHILHDSASLVTFSWSSVQNIAYENDTYHISYCEKFEIPSQLPLLPISFH